MKKLMEGWVSRSIRSNYSQRYLRLQRHDLFLIDDYQIGLYLSERKEFIRYCRLNDVNRYIISAWWIKSIFSPATNSEMNGRCEIKRE